MPVTLTGSEGWFNRQGAFAGEVNRVAALYGSATAVAAFDSIWLLFASSDQAAVTDLPSAQATWQNTGSSYTQTLVNEAQLASRLQCNRDFPLSPDTFAQSAQVIHNQMVDTAQSINRPTVTGTVTDGSTNLGDTKVFFSNTNIYGDPLDMTVPETVTVTCTSQGSGFNATLSAVGEPTSPSYSWDYPQGSGATASLSVVDPAVNGIVTNGGFSAFTVTNTPDNWTILNGTAGTQVFKSTSGGVRSGTDAVYLQSDGASATKLAQAMSLRVNTVYAVTFQVKMNANSASGTLVVQLYDATNAAVMQNDAGSNLEATYNLNGGAGEVTTTYQLLTVFFSTPRQLSASVQLRIGYGTAGVSTRQLFLDLVQVTAATPLYGRSGSGTSGPFLAAVANTQVSAVGDFYEIAVTNSLGTQSFVWGLQRLHDFRTLGVYLPSASSPTISDSLVTH